MKKILFLLIIKFIFFGFAKAQKVMEYKFVCNRNTKGADLDKIILYSTNYGHYFAYYRLKNKLNKTDSVRFFQEFPKLIIEKKDTFICFLQTPVFSIVQDKAKGQKFNLLIYDCNSIVPTVRSKVFFYSIKKKQDKGLYLDFENGNLMEGYTQFEKDRVIKVKSKMVECWKINFISYKKYYDPFQSDLVDRQFFISKTELIPLAITYKFPQNIKIKRKLSGYEVEKKIMMPKNVTYEICNLIESVSPSYQSDIFLKIDL